MAAPYDILIERISQNNAVRKGYAALIDSSSKEIDELIDAYNAEKARADAAEQKYTEEKARADKAENEIEYWKKLAQKPKIVFRDNSRLEQLITTDIHEHYAEDSSIQGQQPLRQISTG